MVDLVDLVDYGANMKLAEVPVEGRRGRRSTGRGGHLERVVKSIQIALTEKQSGVRRELAKLASERGYTTSELSEAIDYLVRGGLAGQTAAERFDPREAGRRIVEELQVAEGGAWTGKELQEQFNLSPATMHRRRKEFRIVYWRDAQQNFHYPKWQFTETGASLPGLQEVLQTLRSQDEWRVMRYFLGGRAELGGRRPLDLLRKGEVAQVVAHTKIHAEENTW